MRKGFTLVELLVSIAIISILAVGILMIINPTAQLQKARDSKRKADLQQIRTALELYRSDHGHYPRTNWVYSTSGDPWISDSDPSKPLTPAYLKTIPKDPINNAGQLKYYSYYSADWCGASAGTTYILYTYLESTTDPERAQNIRYGNCDWPSTYIVPTQAYTVSSP